MSFFNETILYQIDNNWSSESAVIANSLRNAKFENPNLNFDVEASAKSPFNIDLSAINDATTEGAMFDLVYNELLKSPEFNTIFTTLFKDNNRFSVKFEIQTLSNGANGNTDTDLLNPTLNLITISPAFLKSANKIEIAKTILHECIHAYLNVKFYDASQGINIPNLNNLDLFNLINEKYNSFNGNQDQHNFIYNFMLPTMVKVLSEVKDKLVSASDNTNISQNFLLPNLPATTPMVAFNWKDCLDNIALGGLQDCAFFKNEIGTFFPNGEIETTINPVKINNYSQYKKLCKIWLH